MTSDARAGAALLALVAGCGQSVHDLSVTSDPLLVLHGHVDPTTLVRSHPGAALIGALVWAEVASVDPVCLEFDDTRIKSACPDPYGVFNGQIETSAPVAASGDFDLALYHLPMVSVSVGDATTRIAYGSLVVLEDVDGDGQPTLITASSGDQFDGPTPQPANPDTIVAATFHHLVTDQTRVVFREGGFVPNSYFYPTPGCAEPLHGFSIMTAPPYADVTPAAGGCATVPTDTRIDVPPLTTAEGLAYMCRAAQIGNGVHQPRDRSTRGHPTNVCLGSTVLAAVFQDLCPWLQSYALKGCSVDPLCATPEWDLTASPPSWWPCP